MHWRPTPSIIDQEPVTVVGLTEHWMEGSKQKIQSSQTWKPASPLDSCLPGPITGAHLDGLLGVKTQGPKYKKLFPHLHCRVEKVKKLLGGNPNCIFFQHPESTWQTTPLTTLKPGPQELTSPEKEWSRPPNQVFFEYIPSSATRTPPASLTHARSQFYFKLRWPNNWSRFDNGWTNS